MGQYTKYANCIYHDDYGAGKAMGKRRRLFWKPEKKLPISGLRKRIKRSEPQEKTASRAGLKSAGIELEDACTRKAEFTMDSGYEAALDLLRGNTGIGVLSCATDTIAAGAIEALLTYGRKKVPREAEYSGGRMDYILASSKIRVTGFGDNQFLKAVTGGIPTVHFGYKTSGIRGAELLLDVIERGEKIPLK